MLSLWLQTIEWEWDAFDNLPGIEYDINGSIISINDYDALVNWDAYPTYGYYDWTHFNAMEYDSNDHAIYLSSRHLSRIYKISIEIW